MPRTLSIPREVLDDEDSFEFLRIWEADDGTKFVLRYSHWPDPAIWGIVLIDLMRNIAVAHKDRQGIEFGVALRSIKKGFDLEWENPTASVE